MLERLISPQSDNLNIQIFVNLKNVGNLKQAFFFKSVKNTMQWHHFGQDEVINKFLKKSRYVESTVFRQK